MEEKNIELHQQVDKLSTSAMLVNERVNTYQERIRNIKLFSAHLVSKLQETPQIASNADRVLEALPSQCNNTITSFDKELHVIQFTYYSFTN